MSVIEGTLEDEEGLKKAAVSGATVFVSFAGPVSSSKGTVGLLSILALGLERSPINNLSLLRIA